MNFNFESPQVRKKVCESFKNKQKKNPRIPRVFQLKTEKVFNYLAASIEAIAASTPSIESAAFLIRASASTSTSSAVA